MRVLYEEDYVVRTDDARTHGAIAERTSLTPGEAEAVLNALGKWGLVEMTAEYDRSDGGVRSEGYSYYLTNEGFEVAHDRELTVQQNRTNGVLAVVTAGLFVSAIVQAFSTFVEIPVASQRPVLLLAAVAAALSVVALWRYDVL